jgi:hypothetical protein
LTVKGLVTVGVVTSFGQFIPASSAGRSMILPGCSIRSIGRSREQSAWSKTYDQPEEAPDAPDAGAHCSSGRNVEFKNVVFFLSPDTPVPEEYHFKIGGGSR